MEINAEAMGEHVPLTSKPVTAERVLCDLGDRYAVALWVIQMYCEHCPMATICKAAVQAHDPLPCGRGFAERADEWRELWRKMV